MLSSSTHQKVYKMDTIVGKIWQFIINLRVDLLIGTYLVYKFHRRAYVFFRCFWRDIRFLRQANKIVKKAKALEAEDATVYSAFQKQVASRPRDVCFYYEDEVWTFLDVKDFADNVAQVAHGDGFKKGDVIALVMGNRPEYLAIRVGLSQLGVITALVNHNLRDRPLEHCLNIVSAKGIIVEGNFVSAIEELRKTNRLPKNTKVYQFEGEKVAPFSIDLKTRMAAAPPGQPDVPFPPHHYDTHIYVYSSGTTGLPKACILNHCKLLLGPMAFTTILELEPEKDVLYTCMPMYHLAGGGYGAGNALVCGIPVAIGRKFSASRFWDDCKKHNVTTAQYIGEMCRFLMSQPVQAMERAHKLHYLVGNGLRPSLWKPFQERFKVPIIVEVYGATEGNANLMNSIDNTVGVVGFIPRILPLSLSPHTVIRVDRETGDIIRGSNGLCQRCDIGETGLFVGCITKRVPGRSFEGYVDKEATRKKIVTNVFKMGDRWFNSGDLMVMDELGYLSFVDRCGDTFRWKGENVATAEVEEVIKSILPAYNVAVYGVLVPETEGRCGMIALEDHNRSMGRYTLDGLAAGLKRSLAPYARPLFLRIVREIPVNATFKVTKNVLQAEGYDPNKISDPLYFLDPPSVRYVQLTRELFEDLTDGRIRI